MIEVAPTVMTVEDEAGLRYVLSGKSWRGGQGKVVVDSTGRYIVKLLSSRDSARREEIRRQISKVRVMPLDGLRLTQPLSLLRLPHVGYVMEYLTGMVPISTLIEPPGDVDRSAVDQLITWHIRSGGIKRRLGLLARLATVLNRLHYRGLVYGDLSSNNVFISAALDQLEVYLIDVDNLCFESSAADKFIYTRLFGAPEVFNRRHGVDTLSDAYSLAVLAFETLELGHPLMGDYVLYGDPDLEIQAQAGQLPWVYHETDNRNQSSHILPKEVVLSDGLFKLLHANFEDGLLDRKARPGVAEWERGLHSAARFVLTCPACKGSYYSRQTVCPWCNAPRPAYLLVAVDDFALNPEGTLELVRANASGACLQYPGTFQLNRRFLGFSGADTDSPMLELAIDSNLIMRIHGFDGGEYWIVHEDWRYEKGSDNARARERITATPRPVRRHDRIHVGALDQTHPVIRFERK